MDSASRGGLHRVDEAAQQVANGECERRPPAPERQRLQRVAPPPTPHAHTSPHPDGHYEIRLRVLDNLGLSGQDVIRVLVDNEAPFAEVTAPVTITAAPGGEGFSTLGDLRLYFPPRGFVRVAVMGIRGESDGALSAA